MELKVICDCGQKYKFDVEPVSGQMPFKVNCPACGADGTAAANGILSETLFNRVSPVPPAPAQASAAVPPPPPTAISPSAGGLRINRPMPAPAVMAPPLPMPSASKPIAPLRPPGAKPNLTWYEYLWIGLPLLLIAIGGAIGGACGGAACAINRTVFLKESNPVLKYVWTGMISAAAFVFWFIIAALLFGVIHGSRTH